ncbi:ShlB/FhaC/HecB family hemolysin secretion/activation protein [Methyloraptor flagellatus]|uniref:ShlB/FhaC/HecB family hemolysin secretion/activation protein n=1 Tax=Methyloraptor flagellatus TaxID=3162530 RepID=A0AAU7XFP2_9HYPH
MRAALNGVKVLGTLLFGGVVAIGGTALAQVVPPVERNLPPVAAGTGRLVIGPQDLSGAEDDTPFGVSLSGITLIGATETPAKKPATGIRVGAIGAVDRAAIEPALAPFLGKPLSRKRIGEIQAAIALVYRTAGYPFVSVTVPPQEVTRGVVTLRVVEFRIGAVKTTGAAAGTEDALRARVRAAQGERIAAEALEEDLAWLNRQPYRTVNGVFAPGDALGLSTLTLEVAQAKPWQVFGGWTNTGSHATGFDRFFAGFGAALPGIPESFVSYQVTGSPNLWSNPASIGAGANQPNYHSQAGRLVISTGARQSLEIAPSWVASRQNGLDRSFAFTNETLEIPVTWRSAISNFAPGLQAGDLVVGAVGKTVSRDSWFTGTNIGGASADLFEFFAGWSFSKTDALGATSIDLRLIANPGGVLGGNAGSRWSTYSGGRVTSVETAYGTAAINRVTRLPAGWNWVASIAGTAAGEPLPDTEQLGLGGLYATRGYTIDDASVDTGIVWRNELRTPTFSVLSAFGGAAITDRASPFAFLDFGWGRTFGYQGIAGPVPRKDYSLAGAGLGLDYTIEGGFTASVVGGFALSDATYTRAGDFNVQARLFVSY